MSTPTTTMSTAAASLPRSQKCTILYKSNLNKSFRQTHPSGILHAIRSSPTIISGSGGQPVTREEHTFAWIQTLTSTSETMVKTHLAKYGFDSELTFIPYTTRAAWCTKYPNAIPYVECIDVVNSAAEGGGGGGVVSTVVRGYPLWSPHVNSVTDIPREAVEGAVYHPMYHGSGGMGGAAHTGEDLELAAAMAAAAAAEDGTNNNNKHDEHNNNEEDEYATVKNVHDNQLNIISAGMICNE